MNAPAVTSPLADGLFSAPFGPGAVHVLELPVPAADPCPGGGAGLAPEERRRARAFASPLAMRRFVASRLALRAVLSRRVGAHRPSITVTFGTRGKPGAPASGLDFNIAHCSAWIVIAFVEGREVGVDVEEAFAASEAAALARRVLAEDELARLAACAPAARPGLFQRYWVAKEALLKASGDGFRRSPAGLQVDLVDGCAHIGRRPYTLVQWAIDERTRAAVALAGIERAPVVRHRCTLDDLLIGTDSNDTCVRCG